MSRWLPYPRNGVLQASGLLGQTRHESNNRRQTLVQSPVQSLDSHTACAWDEHERRELASSMAKRINVVLQDTGQTIRRVAKPGERSWYIIEPVQRSAATRIPEALRELLKPAAVRDRDIEEESW